MRKSISFCKSFFSIGEPQRIEGDRSEPPTVRDSARDGQTDQQQAARGASALIDNARWCGYVAKMTEQEAERLSDRGFDRAPIGNERRGLFVRFGVSKQNYDATPLDRWYQRHTGGVLLPVELQEIKRESGNKGGKGYDSAAY